MKKQEYERVRTEVAREYNVKIQELHERIRLLEDVAKEYAIREREYQKLEVENAKLRLLSGLSQEELQRLLFSSQLENMLLVANTPYQRKADKGLQSYWYARNTKQLENWLNELLKEAGKILG